MKERAPAEDVQVVQVAFAAEPGLAIGKTVRFIIQYAGFIGIDKRQLCQQGPAVFQPQRQEYEGDKSGEQEGCQDEQRVAKLFCQEISGKSQGQEADQPQQG